MRIPDSGESVAAPAALVYSTVDPSHPSTLRQVQEHGVVKLLGDEAEKIYALNVRMQDGLVNADRCARRQVRSCCPAPDINCRCQLLQVSHGIYLEGNEARRRTKICPVVFFS